MGTAKSSGVIMWIGALALIFLSTQAAAGEPGAEAYFAECSKCMQNGPQCRELARRNRFTVAEVSEPHLEGHAYRDFCFRGVDELACITGPMHTKALYTFRSVHFVRNDLGLSPEQALSASYIYLAEDGPTNWYGIKLRDGARYRILMTGDHLSASTSTIQIACELPH